MYPTTTDRPAAGPCAAGMHLEQQRAEQSAPTLFDEPPREDHDDAQRPT